MNAALVVIDMIEDYFDSSIWPTSVIPSMRSRLVTSMNELVRGCHSAGIPVIWVRQEFDEGMSDAFPHARAGGMRYAVKGTLGSRLLAELEPHAHDRMLTKRRFSAFYETSLDVTLLQSGASTLILAGITTAWCVRSTAVDAYQRDYDVILAADCMAAFDEGAHRESVEAMDGYIGEALTNAAILHRLRV
ncbi:MAG TPA: isochorismatase family cysteine hydrolase [Rhodothermales bacterium]|nr:isochorismatase family cysteine hydrolase [Rhodothermales bacterium]